MSIENIYCIYDKKAEAFPAQPYFARTDGIAIRAFTDLANRPDNDIGQHPEDYSLFRVGTYDTLRGLVAPVMKDGHQIGNVHLVDAFTLVKETK